MTRYTFPHFEMTPEAVQPDYAKWQSVQIGMSLDEVTEILGQPRKDEYLAANQPYLSYGYIQLPFVPHPRTYRFLVGFDDHGHVFTKQDPFNGRFSVDGLPTTPELIVPADMQVFSHFPRVVDIRCFLSPASILSHIRSSWDRFRFLNSTEHRVELSGSMRYSNQTW